MESNVIVDRLPNHLRRFIIDQPYNEYTPRDHAVWRYVMQQNVRYLKKVAHGSYLDGLKKTGISLDRIPHMYGMNRILKEIGWAAVAVDGFIPPTAFMEFQAHNVLVIAADIRPVDQIEYTPAPDIIHEAAGHAPIIADPEYAQYLKYFGQIGSKAFSSSMDYTLYEAIRHLSILKADPNTPNDHIENAEKHLDTLSGKMEFHSEMAMIRNLHWWTVEYGLVGSMNNPKIYGAGLLSSIGESYSALTDAVKKKPYRIDAAYVDFDITTKQPQLFVTPDFRHLTTVLDEFADKMAVRMGGIDGINKAIESGNVASIVYSSGLQISGVFSDVVTNERDPVYLRSGGPTILCHNDVVIEGHGLEYHKHGFGSPVGKLKNSTKPLETCTIAELINLGVEINKNVEIEFESGINVKGRLFSITNRNGKNLLFSFKDCRVTYQDQVLFEPEWGIYDMAIGAMITSAFSGPADTEAYGHTHEPPKEKTHKINYDAKTKSLHALYQKIRDFRDSGGVLTLVEGVFETIQKSFPDEWLLVLEIVELSGENGFTDLKQKTQSYLKDLIKTRPELEALINNGIDIHFI